MGGGRKKDRTKGCAKPSSSARSAELLANSSELIGFGDFDKSSSILESLVIGDDVPSEVKVVFKKLTKKDEVTRLKAIEEFNSIMETSGETYVSKILPYWPRTYSKLSNDHCRRIRTGAQQAHFQVVKYSGRDLAPQLKALAPTWFISCSDPHPPAASNASKSFELAFSNEKKRKDAVLFCLGDIMSAIEENILSTSINTFKDDILSAEDAENKYYRVVSSSLLAYVSLLDYLNGEHVKSVKSTQERALESPKFWKYAKNKNAMIRSSWFRLICKMCEKSEELSIFDEEMYKKLIALLFNNLEESDPVVAPIIWDCCLHIMLSYSKWRDSMDVQGSLLPQIAHFLENGCEGNGGDIYPKLLPFLSCLSKDDLSSPEFQTTILNSLRIPATTLKKHQLNSLLNAYFELCRYFEKLEPNQNYVAKDAFVWLELALCGDQEYDSVSRQVFDNFSKAYLVFNQSSAHWERIKQLSIRALDEKHFMSLTKLLKSFSMFQKGPQGMKKSIAFTGGEQSEDVKPTTSRTLDSSQLTRIVSDIVNHTLFEMEWDEAALELIIYAIRSFGDKKNFFEVLGAKEGATEEGGFSGVYTFIKKLCSLNKNQVTADLIANSSLFLIRPEEILEFHSSVICTEDDKEWFSLMMLGLTRALTEGDIRPSLVRTKEFEEKFMACVQWATKEVLTSGSSGSDDNSTWLMIKDVCLKYGKFLSDNLLERVIFEFLGCINALNDSKNPASKESIVMLVSNILETLILVENGEVFLRLDSRKDLLLSLFRITCNRDLEPQGDIQTKISSSWEVVLQNLQDTEDSESLVEPFLEGACSILTDLLSGPKDSHVNEAVRRLCTHITHQQKVMVFNGIFKEEERALKSNFPSKELLFERKIFPLRVLDLDFIDFENEMTRRKRILNFFGSLSNDLCLIVASGSLDDELMRNLARLVLYECSLRFDKSSNNEESPFEVIFKSLSQSEQLKFLEYVMGESKEHGVSWSLVLDKVCHLFEGKWYPVFEYEGVHLNHKEIILELKDDNVSGIVSHISDKMSKLENDGIVECITLASRIMSKVDSFEDFANVCFEAIKIKRDEVDFLFSCDIGEMEWEQLLPTLAVIEFFDTYLETVGLTSSKVDPERWVFLLCFASSWIQTIDESKSAFSTRVEVQRFALPLFRLLEKIGSTLNDFDGVEEYKSLHEEWKEFFSAGIYDVILRLFVTVSHNDIHQDVIDALNGALRHTPLDILHEGAGLPPKFCKEDADSEKSQLPENLIFLLNHLGPLVLSPNPSVQTTASHLLLKLMSRISELESSRSDEKAEDTLPHRIIYLLNFTEPIVKTIFDEFKFGEPVVINESVDGSLTAYLRAYLYTCRLVLRLVASANQELRPSWTEYIRERKFLDTLVPLLFCLMRIDEPSARQYADDNSTDIQMIAFNIYHDLLKFLPAMFRHWWNVVDHRVSQIIEKFTIKFVSPLLWEEESQNIISSKTTFKNMTVGVRTSVREVVAVYSLDEGSMDLIISLPNNFPLGPVKVDRNQRIGVGHNQWRKWMLQLTTFLEHQNGSILEGLIIWKNNVDKRFEMVEECCICFYILHGANHTLPKLTCRTCRKKFHSACLYKWFSTSNNSTCPLCRNLF